MIPNPWDVGSARYLQHLGFPALATTSAGFAFSLGLPDSGDEAVITRDRSLEYIASITTAVDLPVSADFMSGYVGGALALAAWTGFMRAAQMLRSEGSFAGLASLVPYAEIDGLFASDLHGHQAQER